MAEVSVCGRCGTRSWAGTPFCYACGQALAPAAVAVPATPTPAAPAAFAAPAPGAANATLAPAGAAQPAAAWVPTPTPVYVPPGRGLTPEASGFYAPSMTPAYALPGPYGAAADPAVRPFGIVMLALAEIVVGLVGLVVVYDYLYWADWRFTYDGSGGVIWGVVDGAFALAYIATSVTAFGLVPRLWKIQAGAWPIANVLSLASIGLIVASVTLWGSETLLDPIGVVAYLSLLVYLNLTQVRRLFGRAGLVSFGPAS